jgi:hypothetical protein
MMFNAYLHWEIKIPICRSWNLNPKKVFNSAKIFEVEKFMQKGFSSSNANEIISSNQNVISIY